MKRLFSVLLVIAMLATLLAVNAAAKDNDLLAQIQERGKIVVGLEGNWSPWSFVDDEDNLVGFDVEVAQQIAAKLGVEVEFVPCDWDGLFVGLDVGIYDMIVNGVEVTEERVEKFDFADPYAYIRTALIVGSDNDTIKSFEDLEGKTTANSLASTYMNLAESYGANVLGVETLDETLMLVLQGRIDATLNAIVSYTDYMAQHPDAALKVAAVTEEASNVAIPMRKSEETASLREAVNQAIAELHEEGVISELSMKYFGEDISK